MKRSGIGVAFIGAGTVAEMHGRGVAAVQNSRFIGAYDPDRGKAQASAAKPRRSTVSGRTDIAEIG